MYTCKTETCRYFGHSFVPDQNLVHRLGLAKDFTRAYEKIVFDDCVYISNWKQNKRSNCLYAILKNGNYVTCELFLYDTDGKTELAIVRDIEVINVFGHFQKIVKVSDMLTGIRISEIWKPCIVIDNTVHNFISSVPNTFICKMMIIICK